MRENTVDTDKRLVPKSLPKRWSGFLLGIVLPAVLAVVLFVLAVFLILIPSVEDQLLEGKKETTRELTRAAVSILDEYYLEETSGRMTRQDAQTEAAARIEQLRYGDEGLDYFWITDTHPTMVMHPYLPELNDQDLTDYPDKRGKKLFVAFVDEVADDGFGFVDYYWQWQDDPRRVVPKLSYVELFEPWQWVIGTGIYIEDVNAAIARFQRYLSYISLAIILATALLLFYSSRQSLKIERRRAIAESGLKQSNEKYQALVAAATEGILMTLDGKCAYTNVPLQDMLGYEPQELADTLTSLLIVNETPTDQKALRYIRSLASTGLDTPADELPPATFDARFRAKEGHIVDALVTATPISLAGKNGVILIVRSTAAQKAMQAAFEESRRQFLTMSDALDLGVFRSTWAKRATLLEANPAMRNILQLSSTDDIGSSDWLEKIVDVEERNALIDRLNKDKVVQDYRVGLWKDDGTRTDASLFAVLVDDDKGEPRYCDGIVEDVTRQTRGEHERDALIAQLQTSLFYLREPINRAVKPALSLETSDTIRRAASLMSKTGTEAVFVNGPDGELMGIVTDHDFRERVVAAGLDSDTALRTIMTAPVDSISLDSPVYEALLRMQQWGVENLAVRDESGKLIGLIRLRDLVQYQESSSVIITESIRRASSLDEITDAHDRLPGLVKAIIDSGADTRYVNRIISEVSDTTAQRLLTMALDELGPAPVPFAFLALGSEGREEQTLLTDQDNALVYDDPPEDQTEAVADYFLRLGTLVCDRLDSVGYAYCEGGVMAKNPRWNLSRSVWKEQFSHWIHNADPQELLELNMLFDFRCVAGQQQYARELRTWVFEEMHAYPLFFIHFAQNALSFKPPLNVLGNIQTTSSEDGDRVLSLKGALMPVVNFARLYALKHRIDSTNTLDRLFELKDRGVISRETYEEMVPDYETLMRIRLQKQAVAVEENREPTNSISPDEISSSEEARLKRLFAVAADLRKKMSYDFLGGITGF